MYAFSALPGSVVEAGVAWAAKAASADASEPVHWCTSRRACATPPCRLSVSVCSVSTADRRADGRVQQRPLPVKWSAKLCAWPSTTTLHTRRPSRRRRWSGGRV
jgi:hypothetical protein